MQQMLQMLLSLMLIQNEEKATPFKVLIKENRKYIKC